jgi:hypothetical protein
MIWSRLEGFHFLGTYEVSHLQDAARQGYEDDVQSASNFACSVVQLSYIMAPSCTPKRLRKHENRHWEPRSPAGCSEVGV